MNDPWIDYLGDGVYAQFDGYAVSLMVNYHRNEPVVVLEPDVLKALNDFMLEQWVTMPKGQTAGRGDTPPGP
jgi:hypothetical protein